MKTVRNAVAVLNTFTIEHSEMGLAEIAERVNIDKVIVHRLLRSMKDGRFIEQDDATRMYRLGPAVGDLAAVRRSMLRPIDHAVDRMHALFEKVGETVHLTQLEGEVVIVTHVVPCTKELRAVLEVGERLPIYCSGPGLLYLAYGDEMFRDRKLSERMRRLASRTETDRSIIEATLPAIRNDGLATVDSTLSDGVKAISAPIFNTSGKMISVVSVLGPSARIDGQAEIRARRNLQMTATKISKSHGYNEGDASDAFDTPNSENCK